MIATEEIGMVIDATIEKVVSGTVEDMKSDILYNVDPKSVYAKTESLLYNLPKLKKAVRDRLEQIEDIKRCGLPKVSKSLTMFIPNSGYVDTTSEFEKTENRIEKLNSIIIELKERIDQIEAAVATVKDDPYFSIIPMKYFDKETNVKIAERLNCDESTVKRRKNKLLETIQFALFKDAILEEMMSWVVA